MKKTALYAGILLCGLASCKKVLVTYNPVKTGTVSTIDFEQFTIKSGEQYCDKNGLASVSYDELKFLVTFDSSAVYTTKAAGNQNDINKLYGFSDNRAQHHEYSARFGWRWSGNALRLFAYVYNSGQRSMLEIGSVKIGAENNCSIKVQGTQYIFTLNGKKVTMPRTATTPQGSGYRLYPYFGGDELAPHDIRIWIRELAQ